MLGTIFVDPALQDIGVGTRTWQFVEARHPETKSWRLATPDWAIKNHHFYEKCGFCEVESDSIIPASEGRLILQAGRRFRGIAFRSRQPTPQKLTLAARWSPLTEPATE